MTPRRAAASTLAAAVSVLIALTSLAPSASAARTPVDGDVKASTGVEQAPSIEFPLVHSYVPNEDNIYNEARLRAYAADGTSKIVSDVGKESDYGAAELSASRSGDRFVTREFRSIGPAYDPASRERIAVRDISGSLVGLPEEISPNGNPRTVTNGPAEGRAGSGLSKRPALSPDGDQVAYLYQGFTGCNTLVRSELRLSQANGSGKRVLTSVPSAALKTAGLADVSYYDDDLLVLGVGPAEGNTDVCGDEPVATGFQTLTTSGQEGTITGLTSTPTPGQALVSFSRLSFSADGSRVSYERATSTGSGFRARPTTVETAPVTRSGNDLTIGMPVSLGAGHSPSVSRDGSTVLFIKDEQLVKAATTGGPVTSAWTSAAGTRALMAAYASAEATAPVAPTSVGTPVRSGASATVPFTVADDPTASLVRVTRTSAGLPARVSEVALPASAVMAPGLVNGRAYAFTVQVVDRSGNVGPAVATALPPTVPTAALRVSGQQLDAGQELRATNGVRFRVGADGNLVSYAPSGRVLWQSRTRATGAVLRVQGDGNLVLRDSAGRVRFQTATDGRGSSVLTVQGDGNVVLYTDRSGSPSWSTRTGLLHLP